MSINLQEDVEKNKKRIHKQNVNIKKSEAKKKEKKKSGLKSTTEMTKSSREI